MKTTRTFASVCLMASCFALVAAANVSVGDQPGVFRMSSAPQDATSGTAPQSTQPVPDPGPAATTEAPGQVQLGSGGPAQTFIAPEQLVSPSAGVTSPVVSSQAYQQQPLFGPTLMFEQNINESLGMLDSYTRVNTRIPLHLVPNTTVLTASGSVSLTPGGNDLYNVGVIFRQYSELRDRIYGLNLFYDQDNTSTLADYSRFTVGFESIGRYFDFFANGYYVTGADSRLSSRTPIAGLQLQGNNVVQSFSELRENAYSGVEAKVGMPVPWLGRRGLKFMPGIYYLESDFGAESPVGFSAQWQLQATEALEVNAFLTNDSVFGTNSWVNISYSLPSYRQKRILRPLSVRERLADPVRRTNTIHTKLETLTATEAAINPATGRPWHIVYVDPNVSGMGTGTLEDPFMTLQQAVDSNSNIVDAIRITPRDDGTSTKLTLNDTFEPLDNQALFSSHKDFALFDNFSITADIRPTDQNAGTLGPLITNPGLPAGGSLIQVANGNRISGLRLDANGTGTAINAVDPVTDLHLICNTFTNYTTAVNLPEASGTLLFDENTFTGTAGIAQTGLNLAVQAGSTANLRVSQNTATNNSAQAVNIVARTGSTVNADNPLGTGNSATGIVDNNLSDGGQGMVIHGESGSTLNLVVDRNTISNNTFNGLSGTADGATINLFSLRGNTMDMNLENGTFLHFLNGGIIRAVTEDANGNGVLDAGEDINGNGQLDQGIVSNNMTNNGIAGLCLFGEDDSTGDFTIGGPTATLGNTLTGNTGSGLAVDLLDTSSAGIDALFNTITGGGGVNNGPAALTVVLDFIDPAQGTINSASMFGFDIGAFDVTNYGFAADQSEAVQNAVLETVRNYFYSIPTAGADGRSPIPDGMQLNIDFVIGDNGTAPSNGATEYYVVNIGDSTVQDQALGAAGGIARLSAIRDANGNGPGAGINNGDFVSNVYASSLTTFGPLDPANAFTVMPDIVPQSLSDAPDHAVQALTSGNLTFTRRALGLVTSHEIGHALSLEHVDDTGAVTPTGQTPIMGTPAAPFSLPIQTLIEPAEFSYTATHLSEGPGDTTRPQNSVQQLVDAVGLRNSSTGRSQANGITIVAKDDARLRRSNFLNNTITGNTDRGLNIEMTDNAVAEDITIQSNEITGNGVGVRLNATGSGALIDASRTIGGSGMNTLGNQSFAQSNTISGNTSDGLQIQAAEGGTVWGNLINNTIENNQGNGVAFTLERGGAIDFGTGTGVAGSNRIISGNTFSGNQGVGIYGESTAIVGVLQQMDLTIQGNTVSSNSQGGIDVILNGPNNIPPGPPPAGFEQNNILNLNVGQTSAPISTLVSSEINTVDGNGGVGIGATINGNGLATVNINRNTITNTSAGSGLNDGDGIRLIRRDSSLLLGQVNYNTSTNNAANGLEVDVQGTNKLNQNQPMVGTVNSVTWTNNILNNNGANGASFAVRGDAQLFANGMANTANNNTLSGFAVSTSEAGNMGDATLPAGDPSRRSLWSGITAMNNGLDGVTLSSSGSSQLMLQITSARIPTVSGAHSSLNVNGDTVISNNGRDGVYISTEGTAAPDILITAETPVTPDSAVTVISGNGTNNILTLPNNPNFQMFLPAPLQNQIVDGLQINLGGNGIRWDAFEESRGSVQVYHTDILGNLAGDSEDNINWTGDPNFVGNDGVLSFQEDLFGNLLQNIWILGSDPAATEDDLFFLPPSPAAPSSVYTAGNLDIDVLGGDGIQFNYFQSATSSLTVGAAGMGNRIQGNQDDGIALTGDVHHLFLNVDALNNLIRTGEGPDAGVTSPTIRIAHNLIGGERDGVAAGNDGDGVSMRSFGFAAAGVPPDHPDLNADTEDGPLFPPNGFGAGAPGPTPDVVLESNTISRNARSGFNIRLQGGAGTFSTRSTPVTTDPVVNANAADYNRITLINNTIVSNGEHGVFLRADSDMNQNRIAFTDNLDRDQDGDGMLDEVFDVNNLSDTEAVTGVRFIDFPFLNFDTVQNTLFTATGNTIQSNGTNTVVGHGIELRIGTGSYVAADIRDNIFGGNLQADLFTGAFYSAMDFTNDASGWREEVFKSIDNSGSATINDVVYLDDTAQLDLRFSGNTGDQIDIRENNAFDFAAQPFVGATPDLSIAKDISATYVDVDNQDPLKGGNLGGVFRIDNFGGLNAPSNLFVDQGVTQSISDEFSVYRLQSAGANLPWPNNPFAPNPFTGNPIP